MSNDAALERFQPSPLATHSGKEVDIPVEVVTDEEAIKALEDLGNVKLPKNMMQNLSKVGIHQSGVGVFKIVRGDSMMNRTRLNLAMDKLLTLIIDAKPEDGSKKKGKKSKKIEGVADLAHKLGYLSSKLTEAHALLVQMETARPGGPHDDEPKHQASFGAGEEIKPGGTSIVAQTVNIHEAAKPPA